MTDSEDKTVGLGLKIVSMAPTRYAPSRKLIEGQDEQRKAMRGIDIAAVGIPLGLDRIPLSVSKRNIEARSTLQLQELISESDLRPPLVKFSPVREVQGEPMQAGRLSGQELVYRLYHAEGKLVRAILEQAGFMQTESHEWNVLWAGTVPPRYLFDGLADYQKINHYPRTEELTRKDRFYRNISKMQEKFGKENFDFLPETYILPEDFSEFAGRFQENSDWLWIAKPHASSQGKGIFLVESLSDAIVTDTHVVSRYIGNPLLVDNLKFDLRIYVLVTSYDPLRVYLYEEGLARFASEEYQMTSSKRNKFVHLTNYSVNKKNEKFVQNVDYRKDNVGHKWSLSALFQRLRSQGIDIELIWMKIYDAVIKSVLSITDLVLEASYETGIGRANCFDLFGFDILIDTELKPWVLEVNLSPSLATDSPLDLHIKGHLIADTFNLVGIRAYDRRKESMNRTKARLRAKRSLSGRPGSSSRPTTAKSPDSIPSWKTKDMARDSVEEYLRKGHFLRIYPSKGAEHYDAYFLLPRPSNLYLRKYLFSPSESLANESPESLRTANLISSASERRVESAELPNRPRTGSIARGRTAATARRSVVFSEEEIMVEYAGRLLVLLAKGSERDLRARWYRSMETFLSSECWEEADQPHEHLWKRLELRYNQLKSRQSDKFRSRKDTPLASFSNTHLEDYLRRLPSGPVHDLIQPLLRRHSGGILSELSQPRSHTIGHFHASDEEEEITDTETKNRPLEPGVSVASLRLNLKPPVRPGVRKTIRAIRR